VYATFCPSLWYRVLRVLLEYYVFQIMIISHLHFDASFIGILFRQRHAIANFFACPSVP
jgi:hypothetical protein